MFGGKRSQIRIQISDSGKKLTFPISNNFWIFCRALMLASFFLSLLVYRFLLFCSRTLSSRFFILSLSVYRVKMFIAFLWSLATIKWLREEKKTYAT